MTIYKEFKVGGNNQNPLGGIAAIIMLIVGLIFAFLVVKGIFYLLFWLSPVLLIAGVAIDPKSALNLGKSFLQRSKKNPLVPIILIILSVMWVPLAPILIALVGGFLLSKALIKKKIAKVFNQGLPRQESDEFVEYEEVVEDETFLELPDATKEKQSQKSGNEYDNLFE